MSARKENEDALMAAMLTGFVIAGSWAVFWSLCAAAFGLMILEVRQAVGLAIAVFTTVGVVTFSRVFPRIWDRMERKRRKKELERMQAAVESLRKPQTAERN